VALPSEQSASKEKEKNFSFSTKHAQIFAHFAAALFVREKRARRQ
jgi:hypothetical protein